MESGDIGNIGERLVTAELQAAGWKCHRNTQLPGATDIEARAGDKGMLVQVKTAVFPNTPEGLAFDEDAKITFRAMDLGFEAYLAKVQIDEQGNRLAIEWIRLSLQAK